MADPISVTGTVVGVISLGIQVTQSLVSFYNSYKGQNSDLSHTTDRLNSLLEIFQSLKKTLSDRKFLVEEQDLAKNIETSIQNCEDWIHELQDEVLKFKTTSSKEPIATIKITGRRLAYPFRQSTLQKLDEDIKDIRANLSSALDALQLKDNKKIQDDITETKDLLGLVRTSQVSMELREWLKAPDAFIDHHAVCAKKQPGSGVWLVKSDQFSRWLTEENSFMWLNGFAGSGKSVLCSTAINFALQHRRSDPEIGIAFFYFTFNDNSKQDESAMLRALLLQLSDQAHNNNADLTKLHDSYKSGVPSSLVLTAYLQRVIQRFRQVYIILDALDESPRSLPREHVLVALETMRKWGLQCLHLLVTSRDERDIRESFDLLPAYQVKMQNSGIDKDIEDFISGRLDTDRKLKNVLPYRERIQESLTARAKGMFRWVDCQLQTLRSCLSEHHLDIMLKSLPESLDETYERMLSNIDSYWKEDARRMLTMLCFALRPLTVQELIDSVAVEMGESAGLNRKRRLQDSNGIRKICGGLVDIVVDEDFSEDDEDANEDWDVREERDASMEISHKDPRTSDLAIVRIAHFSVQEYLESKRIQAASFGLSSITAHVEIAEVCLIYLLEPGLSRSELNRVILKEYPLAEFAATFWYYHYRKTKTTNLGLDTCILSLFQSQTSFATWVRLYDVDHAHGPDFVDAANSKFSLWDHSRRLYEIPTPMYYASLLGLDKVLHGLLPSEQAESIKTSAPPLTTTLKASEQIFSAIGRYGDITNAAAYHGHDHVVQILLDSGLDINDQGDRTRDSALVVASSRGHAKLVQMLLVRGADVNAQGGVNTLGRAYGSALQEASGEGHKEVVRMLLDRGADVNAQYEASASPLQRASLYGYKEVVEILLNRGADVNAPGGFDKFGRAYSSALQEASYQGYKEIVQILLGRGADVNAQDHHRSALQEASGHGRKEVVRMLLDSGAEVNVQGCYGSALQEASGGGHKEVVRMLLDRGAEVNAQHKHWSALQVASNKGHKEVVRMLLDRGAEVNAQGHRGSALHQASDHGHKEVVRMLLDRGAEVNAQHEHWSALQEASGRGHKEVVRMLLDRGAEVNAQGHRGSALQVASGQGHKEIVRMLLDRGAEVNAQGYDRSALQEASDEGHKEVVEILLDSDARVSIGGSRALKAAVGPDHSDIVQILLNRMNAEDFDNEWQMASSSDDPWDHDIMELLQTHDFPFRHKPSITEEA